MARTKAADQKAQNAEGVALNIPKKSSRYEDGVRVAGSTAPAADKKADHPAAPEKE